ncbi:MAG: signal recognition particle-docking protein FtsY [Mycoplasmataceae bacterium]|nr:signal recognition particle-docking protein FtsY [Mycoplasmataceae bacterium]
MGFFGKIKELFSKKKKVDRQVKAKNEKNIHIEQKKFDEGLKKSSNSLKNSINELAKKYRKVDQKMIDEIEEILLMYDIGFHSTKKILNAIVEEIKIQNINDGELIKQIIIDKLFVYYIQDTDIDIELKLKEKTTNVILVSGVNGVGKTTSIAKLAHFLKKQKMSVCLIAADTFRAGAVKQLEIWAERLRIKIFKPLKEGQDPASVVYEGVKSAKENNIDVVLCDTSGRLQNKTNLMNELKKMNNIIKKFDGSQPIESLLVLDATSGQNGILQAKAFNEITKLTGIILTKMDSSSKGGIILSIKDAFNLPIKFIGLGEQIEDLEPFDLEMFINGLVKEIDFVK